MGVETPLPDHCHPPAETSSVSSTTPCAWKEEGAVLMRSRVWLARGGRHIAGGERQIVKAAQDKEGERSRVAP